MYFCKIPGNSRRNLEKAKFARIPSPEFSVALYETRLMVTACIGVLLNEAGSVSGVPVRTVVRHAVQKHNDMASMKYPAFLHFKLDKHEKTIDATDSFKLSQASTLSHFSGYLFLLCGRLVNCITGNACPSICLSVSLSVPYGL